MKNPFARPRGRPASPPQAPTAPTDIDLTGLAFDDRQAGILFDDERMTDDSGALIDVSNPTLVEERAQGLETAATEAVLADTWARATPHHARSEELRGQLEGELDSHRLDRSAQIRYDRELRFLEDVPNHERPKGSKTISLVGKGLMVGADTALMANNFTLQGHSLPLAVTAGVGLASVGVAAGAQIGRTAQIRAHRAMRGPAPDDAPAGLRHLYAADDEADRKAAWSFGVLAAAASTGVGVGTALFGLAGGSVPAEALGYGLLASVTVLGSAALEAFGTNQAADRLEKAKLAASTVRARIAAYAARVGQRNAETATTEGILREGRHQAAASGIGHRLIEDTRADSPRIFGYESRRSDQELAMQEVHDSRLAQFVLPPTEYPGGLEPLAGVRVADDDVQIYLEEVEHAEGDTDEAERTHLDLVEADESFGAGAS